MNVVHMEGIDSTDLADADIAALHTELDRQVVLTGRRQPRTIRARSRDVRTMFIGG